MPALKLAKTTGSTLSQRTERTPQRPSSRVPPILFSRLSVLRQSEWNMGTVLADASCTSPSQLSPIPETGPRRKHIGAFRMYEPVRRFVRWLASPSLFFASMELHKTTSITRSITIISISGYIWRKSWSRSWRMLALQTNSKSTRPRCG